MEHNGVGKAAGPVLLWLVLVTVPSHACVATYLKRLQHKGGKTPCMNFLLWSRQATRLKRVEPVKLAILKNILTLTGLGGVA